MRRLFLIFICMLFTAFTFSSCKKDDTVAETQEEGSAVSEEVSSDAVFEDVSGGFSDSEPDVLQEEESVASDVPVIPEELSSLVWQHYDCDPLLFEFYTHTVSIEPKEGSTDTRHFMTCENSSFYYQVDSMLFDILNGFDYAALLDQVNNSFESAEYDLYELKYVGSNEIIGFVNEDNVSSSSTPVAVLLAKHGIGYAEFDFKNGLCYDIHGAYPVWCGEDRGYDMGFLFPSVDSGTDSLFTSRNRTNRYLYENMYCTGGFRFDGFLLPQGDIVSVLMDMGFPDPMPVDHLHGSVSYTDDRYPLYFDTSLSSYVTSVYLNLNVNELNNFGYDKSVNLALHIDPGSGLCDGITAVINKKFNDHAWDFSVIYLDGELFYQL